MDTKRLLWTQINYFESWHRIIGGSERSESREFDGLLVTSCGIPAAAFNVAFVRRRLSDPARSIDRVVSYFGERDLPGLICFPPHVDPLSESLVADRGYKIAESHPGMTLHPISSLPDTPAELAVRRVTSDVDLEQFQSTAAGGFGAPPALTEQLLSRRLHAHPSVLSFLGHVDGEAACTSCLITTGPVAGIYWVSTLEKFRQRGYGAAMTAHAIRAGQSLGCDVATLQASAMGLSVYEEMGFKRTSEYRNYEVHPPRAR
jgi:ribosomal protein S18 acetylase RimI-like enzyme